MILETVRSTTRSDCGHGGATRRAGEARASAPIRALLAAFVALLAVHFMSGTAYADSVNAEVISGPSQVPILDMYGASIAAPDRYTAAALLMGYGPDAISGWDDDVKAKLSNEGTGGQFYIFANNSIQNYFDITEHTGIFQQFFDFVGGTFWNAAQALYGNNLWAALYTSDELAAAKADLEHVLSGENIGGGGSSGNLPDDGVFYTVEFTPFDASIYSLTITNGSISWISYATNSNQFVYKLGSTSYYVPYTAQALNMPEAGSYSVKISKNLVDTIISHGQQLGWQDAKILFVLHAPYGNSFSYVMYLVHGNNVTRAMDNNGRFVAYTYPSDVEYYKVNLSYGNLEFGSTWPDSVLSLPDFLQFNKTVSSYELKRTSDGLLWNTYDVSSTLFDSSGVVGGTPVEPPTPPSNWPDEPEAPEPPELPEPGTNPTVTPTPWAPVISPTLDFDLNITTEPTSNDLIDWVKKIYFELRSFHSDAQDWFDEVGKGIDGVVKALDDAQKQIYSELQTIDDTLRDEGQKIRDYMYQMFHWLKDQLNFQNDSFNDSNIVYWLKRIWSKLGNGDINVRPTDPTTDPTGVWDWLIKLIQNFIIGLASSANDLISEMADLVSQVMHEFPFSIPWDIAAFLSAFAAAPITPDVDVTIPAIEGWWGETVISIDLSPYDTAAAAVRAMEKILFAAFLAWKSKDLLEFMDVTKWFNG